MTITSFILYYLSGLTLMIVIGCLYILKLFWEIRLSKIQILFLLKERTEKYWDSSKAKMVFPDIKAWDRSE